MKEYFSQTKPWLFKGPFWPSWFIDFVMFAWQVPKSLSFIPFQCSKKCKKNIIIFCTQMIKRLQRVLFWGNYWCVIIVIRKYLHFINCIIWTSEMLRSCRKWKLSLFFLRFLWSAALFRHQLNNAGQWSTSTERRRPLPSCQASVQQAADGTESSILAAGHRLAVLIRMGSEARGRKGLLDLIGAIV